MNRQLGLGGGSSESLNSGGILGMPEGPALVVQLQTYEAHIAAAAAPTEKVSHSSRIRGDEGNNFINLSTILSEGSAEPPPRTFTGEATAGDNNSLSYRVLLESQNITYDIFTDVLSSLKAKYNEDYFRYLTMYAFGSVFNKTV
ncbi:hypothetical protein HPB50_009654 [Hyalomma asiaticum]|uniref:Uncharacterized protein n=1 Tax=Hyalomma asiaticum TaxID=266040 RepID=A0ACB7S6H3_HYAAI|nr:hypothetical protein HPB50_009654 [Hyalomma asiaticum]